MLVPSEWNSGVNVLLEQSVEKKEKQKKEKETGLTGTLTLIRNKTL